jgi:hypothetical protein
LKRAKLTLRLREETSLLLHEAREATVAINPNAPLLPEMDIALLSGTGEFVPNSPGYPEIDISLLPGVPNQRGAQGPTGATGPRGATGPTGPGVTAQQILDVIVPAVSYKHTQNSASTTWTITHNLGFYPNVTTLDSAGTTIEGSITFNSVNQLTVAFSVALTGTAYLS